jgi:hypothetical protein
LGFACQRGPGPAAPAAGGLPFVRYGVK